MTLYGPFSLVSSNRSWGLVLTNIALGLRRQGLEIKCVTSNGQIAIDPRIRPYMSTTFDDVTISYVNPPELRKILSDEIYAMWGFESSVFPQGWAKILSQKPIHPIVNSTAQQNIFALNGIKAQVVPPPPEKLTEEWQLKVVAILMNKSEVAIKKYFGKE